MRLIIKEERVALLHLNLFNPGDDLSVESGQQHVVIRNLHKSNHLNSILVHQIRISHLFFDETVFSIRGFEVISVDTGPIKEHFEISKANVA